MTAKFSPRAITQAPYPRAMIALIAATLAVLIDPIFRFSDYRALLHSLQAFGAMKFSVALTLVFLQVVALFYLILLLPRLLPHGGPPSFCFRCCPPILLLADTIPVHDRHRRVSSPDRRRGQSDRSHLKLLQAARLLVCSPLRTRSVCTDPGPPCDPPSEKPSPSASCRRSTSSLPITPSSSTCRNAASI